MAGIEINDPSEFGRAFAEEFVVSGALDGFDGNNREIDRRLVEIDERAQSLRFLNEPYLVTSRLALSIPVSIDADEQTVSHIRFDEGLMFKGDLVTHSAVKVGRFIGGNAIRALCLTFDNITLLPFFDSIPDDHLLYVPAFSIQDIDRLARAS